MGESKQRSRRNRHLLDGEPRCIYCPAKADSIEHMPPKWMFERNDRPSGMEYPACKGCNEGTRAADLAVGWFARLHPTEDGPDSLHWAEVKSRESALRQRAPGLVEEVFDRSLMERVWVRSPTGVLQEVTRIQADGPLFAAHMLTFGAKLAMALFREHTGTPLPLNGMSYVQPFANGGINQEMYNSAVSILPGFSTLRQGRKEASKQFSYRYNTDEKSVVAAMVTFHANLYFLLFASADPGAFDAVLRAQTAAAIQPGELLAVLHSPASMISSNMREAAAKRQ